MSNIDVFTIDDDFDPLAELAFETPDAEEAANTDYLPPIPDADKSIVPAPVPRTAEERIEELLKGLPGQTFRVLAVVQAADACEPREAAALVADVDAAWPDTHSVYDTARLVRLLTEAGALEVFGNPDGATPVEEDGEDIYLTEDNFVTDEDGETYLVVAESTPARYQATEAGRDAVARHANAGALAALIEEEPRYAPLYARIFALVGAEGGAARADLDAAIDPDPLCESPRRFCGYFMDKLETAGFVRWHDLTWTMTDLGRAALATGVLDEF